MVAEQLAHHHTPVTSVDELWHPVEAAWASVPIHATQSLFDSMPVHCTECQIWHEYHRLLTPGIEIRKVHSPDSTQNLISGEVGSLPSNGK
ncbi:hypothetical protein TNCV_4232031 [Trichonephila clavipes]|nr:hypothetical protein TNCV_4232031 [Trichonephila clavipes]